MNIKNSILSLAAFTLLAAGIPLASARASFPSLTLSSNGSMVQALISNADPNQPVNFHYPTGSVIIGNTDSNGYLTANITPSTYNLSLGNPVYVVVNGTYSPTATWPAVSGGSSSGTSLYLTQTAVTVTTGQSTTVTASNFSNNDLSIPGNTNPSAVTASISGSTINITGLANGTAVLTICSSSSGCANINVTVQPNSINSPAIYLNPSSISLNINQSQTVAITGYASGPYYVSTNSNNAAVSAAISSNSLILTGLSSGASNITVCATGGQCGTATVTVSGATVNGSNANLPLALQSVTIASNGTNGAFASTGNVLTVSFTADQPIINPQLNVNGQNILVSGAGNGPYTATYSVTSNQSSIPVTVAFANSSGASVQSSFTIGGASSAPAPTNTTTSTNTTTTVACPAGYTCTSTNASAPAPTASAPAPAPSASSHVFDTYLYMGMNNKGDTDPDVVALQERLKKDGFFNGFATGYFGPQTKAAVIAFQKAHGLTPLGVVGPSTRILLNQGL